MAIRAKTKKRVLILFVGVLVIGGAVAAWAYARFQENELKIQQYRADGMAAAAVEDHRTVLNNLSRYLSHVENHSDVEALYAFASARAKISEPRAKHLFESVQYLRRILQIEPDHQAAQDDLLQLYLQIGYLTEARDLADQILVGRPELHSALLGKATAMLGLRRLDEALAIADRCIEIQPQDLQSHLVKLQLMSQMDAKGEVIVAHAAAFQERFPDDPQFKLLLSYAHELAFNQAEARKWLEQAAGVEPPNQRYAELLLAQMDRYAMFNESMALLDKYAANWQTPYLMQQMIRRLWQNGQNEKIIERLSDLDPTDRDSDTQLLAFRAIALNQSDRRDEAQPILEALEKRGNDNDARAWVPVIRSEFAEAPPKLTDRIQTAQTALTADPLNPYIYYFLGNHYFELGEMEMAIGAWRQAANPKLSTSWAAPYVQLARAFAATGRFDEAREAAKHANFRSPNNLATIIVYAVAQAQALKQGRADLTVEQLIEVLAKIQEASPGEEQTIALYIDTLVRNGQRERAIEAARAILASDESKRPSLNALIRLAVISQQHRLELEDQCLQLAEQLYGQTPDLVLARAAIRAAGGQVDEGRRYIENIIQQQGPKPDLRWRVAWAQFLEGIKDPDAAKVWMALADQNPERMDIQRAALSQTSVQQDRAFMDRTIERIRNLTGEQGLAWRLARARWLLQPGAVDADPSKAVLILQEITSASPELIEPRLLLSEAHMRLNNPSGAINQLTEALSRNPNMVRVMIRLAQIRLSQSDLGEVRRLIDRVLRAPSLAADERQQVAILLAAIGEKDKAIAVLTDGPQAELDQMPPSPLLAQLLIQKGDYRRADSVYAKLMDTEPNAATISAYANFLAATGRRDQALQTLARLRDVDIAPFDLEMLVAEFHRNHISAESAIEHYRAAIAARPNDAAAWRRLIDYYFVLGRMDDAFDANKQAIEAVPGDPVFSLISGQSQLIRRFDEKGRLRPLLSALVNDADHRDAVIEVLQIIDKHDQAGDSLNQIVLSMRPVADKYPRFVSLQNLLVDMYLGLGGESNNRQAAAVASRTMQAMPLLLDPAERATRAYMRLNQWDVALTAARDWRQRPGAPRREVDMMIASALIGLNRHGEARRQLDPYLSEALADPDQSYDLVRLHCRALIGLGQVDQAADILKPLLTKGPQWRVLWRALAMDALSDKQAMAAWLSRLEAVTPPDAHDELSELMSSWYVLGKRFNDEQLKSRGRSGLEAAANVDDATADLLVRYGTIEHNEGNTLNAKRYYRLALGKDEYHAVALNNLAMLLADEKQELDEALKFAQRSVERNPRAETLDTLAYVYRARGDYDQAIDALSRAVRNQPESIEWRINLVDAYLERGKEGDQLQARSALRDIDAVLGREQTLRDDLSRKLRRIRQTLAAPPTPVPAP